MAGYQTGPISTVKLADIAPAGTSTVSGVLVSVQIGLFKLTSAPPVGAGFVSVTTPVAVDEPQTEVGVIDRDCRDGVVVSGVRTNPRP